MRDVNAMDNAKVDEAIAVWLGYAWEQITEGLVGEGEWMWMIPEKGQRPPYQQGRATHELPSWTSDRTLTGDMLCGDEAKGEPGLWSRFSTGIASPDISTLDPPVAVARFRGTYVRGQGDTEEERRCSAVARAYLLLLDEGGGAS